MKRNEYIDPEHLEFHYNREERVKTLDPAVRSRDNKVPFFKRNKYLKFILLDILLIVLIFLIIQPLITTQKRRKNVYGCNFRLESMLYEDNILLSLKIAQKNKVPAMPDTVQIKIFLNNDADPVTVLEDKIDFDAENRMYIRAEIEYTESIKNIHAEVVFGEKAFRLHNTVKGL